MKILQIIYESFGNPYGFGGAGVRAYEIYKRLKDKHDITLLCMRYPGAEDNEIQGLKHIFLGTESKNLTKSVLAYVFRAADFVRRYGNDFDIIVENFLPTTPFFIKFFTKTPIILQIQGIMEKHALRKFNPFYSIPIYFIEKCYPLLYKRFIFVSNITKEKLMYHRKDQANISHVIPNGINKKLLEVVPEESDYILFFSRLDIYTKGLDILIEAFEMLSSDYPNIRLIVAGYEFDKFQKLISKSPSSLKGKVKYAGFVSNDEKVKLLSRALMCILPSRHESSPVSILEAAACQKPLIVSDIPELSFVASEGFGISFPSGSSKMLAEKIRQLLNDSEQRQTLGKRGREFAAQFLWDNIANQFENMLNYKTNI